MINFINLAMHLNKYLIASLALLLAVYYLVVVIAMVVRCCINENHMLIRSLGTMERTIISWSKSEVEIFIAVAKTFPQLYNPAVPDFHNRAARNAAYQSIRDAFIDIKPHVTLEDVKKKLAGLKSTYLKEKRRLQSTKAADQATPLKSSLYYYDAMAELDALCGGEMSMSMAEDSSDVKRPFGEDLVKIVSGDTPASKVPRLQSPASQTSSIQSERDKYSALKGILLAEELLSEVKELRRQRSTSQQQQQQRQPDFVTLSIESIARLIRLLPTDKQVEMVFRLQSSAREEYVRLNARSDSSKLA